MYDSISNYIIEWRISKGKMSFDDYDDVDYLIRGTMQGSLTLIFILLATFFLHCWIYAIVISICLNILRKFTGGYHAPTLELCTFFSIGFISILSFIAKYTQNLSWILFYISLLMGLYLIRLVPNIDIEDKEHEDIYYRNQYIKWFLFFIFSSLVSLLIPNQITQMISASISLSIFAVFLTMKNLYKFNLKNREGVTE